MSAAGRKSKILSTVSSIIPAGTTGDLILKDNWVSQRNRAKPKSRLDNPFVVEDTDNQTIYFCYEIGTIENVPLYTTEELQCVNGIIYIIVMVLFLD